MAGAGRRRGRAIAARLNLADPRNTPACLACHADPAAPAAQHADGVGCEACHGAAERWLASHVVVAASHAQNVARGMIPLERARARADNCLDCHYGSARSDQFVDHRLLAAGHPRLSFELDLFSTLQQHWNDDTDYAARKGRTSGARMWAVGQAAALARALALYTGPRNGQGTFPELAFFDCQTCHRRVSDEAGFRPSALANPGRPIPLGMPAFQDENMIMLSAIARIAAPALSARYEADARAFHRALAADRTAAIATATRLRGTADALAERLGDASFDAAETRAMLRAVASDAAVRYTDYEGSVQAVMALDTLLSALVRDGAVSLRTAAAIRPDIDRAYGAVHDANAYQPLVFRAALARAAEGVARP